MKAIQLAYILTIGLLAFCTTTEAQNERVTGALAIPHIQSEGGLARMIVDGKPWLCLAGELHNSTSSAPGYFTEALKNAVEMNVNTVIASVAWEQFEPQEGRFDYSYVDFILKNAYEHNLKIVLVWFATWKNGESSYAPLWVKKDVKRFYRVKNKAGNLMTAISPFCKEAMNADAKAYVALMKYIREKDTRRAIIMMQPENEVGAFSDMDYNEEAQKQFAAQVPNQLIQYLVRNKSTLETELKTAWETHGAKEKGSWTELFGEQNADAQNFFMTWQYASYINEICRQGKLNYKLPMYVNAWLVQFPGEMPGKYPNGGPVSRVMDIYKAAAPYIDFCSPDIYLPNFKEVCSMYYRPAKNNPLFIPECERSNPGKAWYAFAEHNALGFGPFGIESLVSDAAYAQSFGVLKELLPVISRYQGTGNMHGILKENSEDSLIVETGRYKIKIDYTTPDKSCYGLMVQTSSDEFLIAGIGLKVTFSSSDKSKTAFIGEVLEGGFEAEAWKTFRQLNGDETWHNSALFVKGRNFSAEMSNGKAVVTPYLAPIAVLNQSLEHNLQMGQVQAPGIYKVKLLEIEK